MTSRIKTAGPENIQAYCHSCRWPLADRTFPGFTAAFMLDPFQFAGSSGCGRLDQALAIASVLLSFSLFPAPYFFDRVNNMTNPESVFFEKTVIGSRFGEDILDTDPLHRNRPL